MTTEPSNTEREKAYEESRRRRYLDEVSFNVGWDAARAADAEEIASANKAVDWAQGKIDRLEATNADLEQQIAAVRALLFDPIADYYGELRQKFEDIVSPVTPESREPLLAIDGKPVCRCPGDDPAWRESVGHEDYCPRAVTPESETN